jgi:hypothetical protein
MVLNPLGGEIEIGEQIAPKCIHPEFGDQDAEVEGSG